MKIYHRATGIELNYDEMMHLAMDLNLVWCDIETILVDPETNTAYLLDECGHWGYIDLEKYLVK
jgi:hypothetical protein